VSECACAHMRICVAYIDNRPCFSILCRSSDNGDADSGDGGREGNGTGGGKGGGDASMSRRARKQKRRNEEEELFYENLDVEMNL